MESKKLNILILSWRGPGHPNAGGAEQVTFEHALGWREAGNEVTLFTSFFQDAQKDEVIKGIRIIRKGDYVFGVKIAAFFWYLFAKHPKFDLVIDEFHGIPFFTPIYVRVKRLAFIHEVAGEVWKLNFWPKPFNLIPAYVGTFFEPFVFRFFYRKTPFMTVSESTRDDLVIWGIPNENIKVIHNGIKLLLPKKNPAKEKKFTVVYLGAMSEDKGTMDAIKAFAEIARKDDQWQYWVVGPGSKDYIHKLKILAQELKIANKITYFGFVTDSKKFELLARAHVLINPSVHEGWGLVNIEANSVGIPVVGYNVHGIKDSVKNRETGILVEKGDYRGLAENILKLLKDKNKYSNFQKAALKWSYKYSWDKAIKESLDLIENL